MDKYANKGVFYYLLVNIHPVYQSTIGNIEHIGIAKTQDIKRHDIDKMLKPFTRELKELGVFTGAMTLL